MFDKSKLAAIPTEMLVELNLAVVAEIRARRNSQKRESARALSAGMRAQFWHYKDQRTVRGVIESIARTRAVLVEQTGGPPMRWRVGVTMLQPTSSST